MENAITLDLRMEQSKTEPAVTILAEKLEMAQTILTKLAKRAASYGQVITWTVRTFTQKKAVIRWDGKWVTVDVPYVSIFVEGGAPRIGSYTFLASLERMTEGTIVKSVKDVEFDDSVINWNGQCGHCGKPRARVNGYVIDDGSEYKIVGKSCLRDYMGMDVPAKMLSVLNDVAELGGLGDEDDDYEGPVGRWTTSTWGVIAASYAAISLFGYAKTAEGASSTYARVMHLLGGFPNRTDDQQRLSDEMKERGDFYYEEAQKVIEWAKTITSREPYLSNIRILLAEGYVTQKNLGIVVSSPLGYIKQKAISERAANSESKHIGVLKQRMTVQVTVDRIISIDNMYGQYRIFIFRTEEGSLLRWKTGLDTNTKIANRPVVIGDKINMTCTPTYHGAYQGENQTSVNRCKMEAL
jgi:hypothetical protein